MRQTIATVNGMHAAPRPTSLPSRTSLAGAKLQRKCACGNRVGTGGSCEELVKIGTPISGLLVCRNNGSLCMGAISVTPKNKVSDSEWVMTLQGGAKVYGENGGVCGVTKTTDVSIKDVK